MALLLVAAAAAAVGETSPTALLPHRVNVFKLQHAATAALAPSFPGSAGSALLMTTFGPIGEDKVIAFPSVGDLLRSGSVPKPVTLDAAAKWPNMAAFVPAGRAGPLPAVLEASGFFVSPAKATGEVALLDLARPPSAPRKTKISTDKSGWFYHEARWLDVNGDDRLDVVAARANKPLFGASHSELVAFIQPMPSFGGSLDFPVPIAEEGCMAQLTQDGCSPSAGSSMTCDACAGAHQSNLRAAGCTSAFIKSFCAGSAAWVEQVLTSGGKGPGVGFALVDLDGDNKTQVVASQFFARQDLSIWWCDQQHWSGCAANGTDPSDIANARSVVIDVDPDHAPFFSVSWQDLNGDGKKDLLATTNEANGRGGVFAYEQPTGDWRSQKWVKHTLATGYKPTMPFLPGRGSPGTAHPFFVNATSQQQKGQRPSILVSADDGGFVDLLTPVGPAGSWTFEKRRVVNSTGTIGTLAVGDFNGDGLSDFAVPLYAENKVALYTFA